MAKKIPSSVQFWGRETAAYRLGLLTSRPYYIPFLLGCVRGTCILQSLVISTYLWIWVLPGEWGMWGRGRKRTAPLGVPCPHLLPFPISEAFNLLPPTARLVPQRSSLQSFDAWRQPASGHLLGLHPKPTKSCCLGWQKDFFHWFLQGPKTECLASMPRLPWSLEH